MSADIVIHVDADACPVKDEVYKVALRHELAVNVVANSFMRVPQHRLFTRVTVPEGPDIADDWIAERAGPHTIVITSDILLAERCLKVGARVLSPKGKAFTANSIGQAVATRAIMEDLRGMGEQTSGPAAFKPADRSNFLSALEVEIQKLKRGR
ncbi:MAG TPA: YaiI/YqxD family protein [Henriciella marina]|uniref:YaiI/YqxD family protein n=1 Tax=Henriciella sp. TaxID=1968823 RepID=UPI00183330C4|nr:YaiI/YqxD family protein [Henriciella sp.]HIG23595.1 YaiI/YqxD family protein [Henriciella sp.]HIK65686.1 YaiI/YqxD family protein [Henriciella marina]